MSQLTGGLDEVGWGAGAGPIVSVVAVVSEEDLKKLPKGVTDSKKLSEKRREAMFEELLKVTAVGLGSVEPHEIDKMGPKFALQESYTRALAELKVKPDLLIVDGTDWTNRVKSWHGEQMVVPKADLHHKCVSIASIVAKVVRDTVMAERARKLMRLGLPDYNWAVNKGYFTPDHLQAIEKHGLMFGPDTATYQHRRSYCKNLLGKVKIHGA